MYMPIFNHPSPTRNGFTLIELLLYVSLVSVLLLSVSVFLAVMLAARVKNQAVTEVEQQGQQVVELIAQTVRNAENINSPVQGTSAATFSLDAAGALNDPTVFDISGTVLRVTEGSAIPVALTSGRVIVSSLTFFNLTRASTPGNVQFQFTLTHENLGARNEYDFSQTFISSASLRQP